MPPPVSPPPPPPPFVNDPCNTIGTTFLYKVGLNSAGAGWLAAQPNLVCLGTYAYYQCSPTRSLGLTYWRADINLTRVTILEVPDVLVWDGTTPQSYKLLTRLQYMVEFTVGGWVHDSAAAPGIHYGPGTYNMQVPNLPICYYIDQVYPEPLPIAPMPSPAVGSQITQWIDHTGVVTGWITFTANNGWYDFHADLLWHQGNHAYMEIEFPAPQALQDLYAIGLGFTSGTQVSFELQPSQVNPGYLWFKTSWHQQYGLGHYIFDAPRIRAIAIQE